MPPSRPCLPCLLTLLTLFACRPPSTDPPILTLGRQEIRLSEFERHLAVVAERGHTVDAGLREALLQPFLEERVLVLEARAQGLVVPGATADQEQDAAETLLSREIPKPQISDEEVARYYTEHRDRLRQPETVTLHQILVPTENEARDVHRRLLKDPKSFELLARTRSRSPEASNGGLMGTFERGQLPSDLETAAFSQPVGVTREAVHTPLGYHLLRVDARQAARDQSLAESAARIRSELTRAKTDEAVRAYVQQLLSQAKVNHDIALRPKHDS